MKNSYIVMNSEDSCATSLAEIPKDAKIEIKDKNLININQDIPFGHKFAIKDIKKGDLVKKYGEIIGIATQDINLGDWIHTHNITSYYLKMEKDD